jgi:DNA-binding NtrC family response regulator
LPAHLDERLCRRAAQSDCTLLLTGETGVGKGHLARWLHQESRRHDRAFVPVNCGAIPENLIDSQLFGHVKGAFTGATSDHGGLVRAAAGGTLLLDEVSELPPSAQNRLLRLLQDQEIQPVGLAHPLKVNVRVLAATNADLKSSVQRAQFREDLLYRLDVIQLRVKSLRERPIEIAALLDEFNIEFASLYRQPPLEFVPVALERLMHYAWPGNVRQLRTLVERLHVLCPGQRIGIGDLVEIGQLADLRGPESARHDFDRSRRDEVLRVIDCSGGSIARAAEVFGVHRSTIYRWLNRTS